jgi:hypothetical protein
MNLDDVDAAILGHLAQVCARLDPPPADLDERVRFAIAVENIDIEVARLAEEMLVGSGARAAERARTITFESASLTIMVTITDSAAGNVRLDGWLAPGGPLRVELRLRVAGGSSGTGGGAVGARDGGATGGESLSVTADDVGRFVFDGVRPGLAQLLVHPIAGGGATVVTPSLSL